MATTTLYPNGDGTLTNYTANGGSTKWDCIDEGTASPNDSDYLSCANENTNGFVQLTNTPSDTDTVTACTVKLRLSVGKTGDFVEWDSAQIVGSDETTALTSSMTLSATNTITTYTFNPTVSVSDKTSWDGARLKLRTGTGTTNSAKIYAAQVELTYTPTASGETYNETGAGGATAGGSAQSKILSSLRGRLAAWYNLNETSGNRADSSINSNTLTDTNSVSYATGKQSNGAAFTSSSNQHLSIADNSSINLTSTDWSLSFWAKFTALTNNGGNDYLGIISKGSGGASYAFSVQYRIATAQLQVQFYNGGTTYTLWASNFGSFSTNQWYHVIITFTDSTNATTISVNGTANSGTSTVEISDSYGLSLGRGYYSNTYNSSIILDSVGLWKKVLTTNEKNLLYFGGLGQDFPFEDINATGTGGATLGGTSSVSLVPQAPLEGQGGATLGGTSLVSLTGTAGASGGCVAGGEAVIALAAMFGGVEVDGTSTALRILPCKGQIFIPTDSIYELVTRAWANIYEDIEIHLYTDIDLIDDLSAVQTEADFTSWNHFTIDKEDFIVTELEAGRVALDGGVSIDYSIMWDDEEWGEEVNVYGYIAIGADTRQIYWINNFGYRKLSATNTSLFNVILPFSVYDMEEE